MREQLKASEAALAEGEAAARRLKQQLSAAAGERDEAVRLNLSLQVRARLTQGGEGQVTTTCGRASLQELPAVPAAAEP